MCHENVGKETAVFVLIAVPWVCTDSALHYLGHDTGKLQIAVGVTFPPRDGSTKTWNTPSLQDDCHLVCSRATSGFTLLHPSQLYLVCFQFLLFSTTKIKKRFTFRISSSLILFPAVSLHMKLLCQVLIFYKLEFREQEIENSILTSVPSKNLKIEDYRLVFLFLKNKK